MTLLQDSKLTPNFNVQAKTSAAPAQSGEEAATTSKSDSAETASNSNETIPSETTPKSNEENGSREQLDPEADAIRRRRLNHFQAANAN